MILPMMVTSNGIPGYRIDSVHGQVFASALRPGGAQGLLRSFGGSGEGDQLRLVHQTREHALQELWDACQRAGGNALIGLRFDSSDLGQGSEVCAYGTAVRITALAEGEPGATTQSSADARGEGGPATQPTNWPTMGGVGAAEFGEAEGPVVGHRPAAGQRPSAAEPGPAPQAPQAQAPQAQSPQTPQATAPSGEAAPHPGAQPDQHQNPRSPQQQRPNGDGSWLDL